MGIAVAWLLALLTPSAAAAAASTDGAATGAIVINTVTTRSKWHGASREATLVKEGTGAVRWVPSQSVDVSTRAIARDWSGGNCLRFWMHSAKATGSRLALVLASENPGREGSITFAWNCVPTWQGWREIIAPLKEIGRVRHPLGWHKIDSFRLHRRLEPRQQDQPRRQLCDRRYPRGAALRGRRDDER